jgi:hypothetical protein
MVKTKFEIQKKYWQSPKGKATKSRYAKSLKNKIAQKRYRQSQKGKTNHIFNYQRQKKNHPERIKANQAIKHAIRNKLLQPYKLVKCLFCNKQAQHYHHFNGYEEKYWLYVVPVCSDCHKKIHAGYIL